MLGSQGVVLATAMAVSSTVLFLAFSNKQKDKLFLPPQVSKNLDSHQSPTQNLRSCLSSGTWATFLECFLAGFLISWLFLGLIVMVSWFLDFGLRRGKEKGEEEGEEESEICRKCERY